MPFLQENLKWKASWEERGRTVRRVLGQSIPRGEVVPFSWDKPALPGACGMTFQRDFGGASYLHMTLGLTQPVEPGGEAGRWEFAVRTKTHERWTYQLLYDLVTYWLATGGDVAHGCYLPLVFFRNASGEVSCALVDDTRGLNVVGSIRGLYLWEDAERLSFPTSDGSFHLMTAIAVTEDEDSLAQLATPPHLLLLLRQMDVDQTSDPKRDSVLTMGGAQSKWERISALSHDDVLSNLKSG